MSDVIAKSVQDVLREITANLPEASSGHWEKSKLHTGVCFIHRRKRPGEPYGLEILGDDYTEFGDDEQRENDVDYVIAVQPENMKVLLQYIQELEKKAGGPK